MKRFSYLILLFILTGVALWQSSCTKLCDNGYEGKRCDVPVRNKFIGVWMAEDNPGNITYTDSITAGAGLLEVIISENFAQNYFNKPIEATVDEDNIYIARQSPDSNNFYVEGSASISNNNQTLTWNYKLINATDSPEISTPFTGVWQK